MRSLPNPIEYGFLLVGVGLARVGLIDRDGVERVTDLAWPRVVTGLARTSKSAADVAMVGLAVGPAAIAGIGFAVPFWGISFMFGGGTAAGAIALVSQRYGAEAYESLSLAVRTSALAAIATTIPFAALMAVFPEPLIGLLTSDPAALAEGAAYLQVVAVGIPFAAFNLVGSRVLIGADDAWTPMVVRGGGAVVNIVLNAILIFGLGLGVVGAALGTVVGNVLVTVGIVVGLHRGRLPIAGDFPVQVSVIGRYLDRDTLRDLVEIGTPVVFTNGARLGSAFPKYLLLGMLGSEVVAAYVIAMRVRRLMGTPGWGFRLAASSLVGQELGTGDEAGAEAWGRDIIRFAVAAYLLVAGAVFVTAGSVGRVFVADPTILPLVTVFLYAACVSVVFQGVTGASTGPLRASGDTRWPLYAQLVGRYLVGLPLIALAVAVPEIGVRAVYVSIVAEMAVPAAIVYYRFRSGIWKVVSRRYRPETVLVE